MREYKKLWLILLAVCIATFTILGFFGAEVYRSAPPIPAKFASQNGDFIISHDDILKGQTAWQTTGGMQLGSVLGHGAYQAPDWTADWLHRELSAWLNITAQRDYGKAYAELNEGEQALLQVALKKEYRHNQMGKNDVVILSDTRVAAIKDTAVYYDKLYGDNPELHKSRESFAMKENTLPDAQKRQYLGNFFFWTSWIASTNRPNSDATYTNNWPHEPLIDNVPTAENIMWSITCVVILLAGIGLLVWGWSFFREKEEHIVAPLQDPISKLVLTPSQKALGKYLFVVVALFTFQVFLGGFAAHYTIEGQQFYGIDVSKYFPYSLVRTWHIQSVLFWIATAFLAAGLFLGPIINGGKDPKYQKLGVDVLFYALLFIVVGSFTGNYLAIAHIIPENLSFWFGHQGYEFVDLGRFWQIGKFTGIVIWLGLMLRCVVGALKQEGDKNLLAIFVASVVAVGLFYAPGMLYGEHTNIAVMEYWRWWVVHLWVEGFFEVFATAALAFIFVSLGLASKRLATIATLASASLFLLGGIPGTFHHLYFTGTTTPIMAIGASFSALEVVPLVLLGYEAWEHWSIQQQAAWTHRLKWVIYAFVAVAFWNMFGAGVFGFMINPPLALYYIQGLNTTAVHAHAALFGVYGFLGLGFVLLIARYIRPQFEFNDKLMWSGFWCLNAGLVLMIVISLLPIGVFQAHASMTHGLWYARGEAFMQQDFFQILRWLRMIGDTVFIIGALCWTWQVVQMLFNLQTPKPALDLQGAVSKNN